MSDITVNITTISTSVNVTDNEVSVAVSFIPVDVTLNFEYGVSRAVIDSLLTKENITGLKETDSPEFASLQSKALQSATNGGQIPDTDYSWFKGLFAGLQDKFIFSWIYGLIMLVKDALTRVGLLEDNLILDYTAPADSSEIELTLDKKGNALNIDYPFSIEILGVGQAMTSNVGTIFINDIVANNTFFNTYGNLSGYNGINFRGGSKFFNVMAHAFFIGNSLNFITLSGGVNTNDSAAYTTGVGYSKVSIPSITRLTVKLSLGNALIYAGTRIIIRKL